MTIETSSQDARAAPVRGTLSRIAVGLNGFDEGEDALALGAALTATSSSELLLIAVHPSVLVVLPTGMDWSSLRHTARVTLRDARDRLAPGARMVVESDLSVPRALGRVMRREHRDLLVLGSSRHAPDGTVRIGKRTRLTVCRPSDGHPSAGRRWTSTGPR